MNLYDWVRFVNRDQVYVGQIVNISVERVEINWYKTENGSKYKYCINRTYNKESMPLLEVIDYNSFEIDDADAERAVGKANIILRGDVELIESLKKNIELLKELGLEIV
jgi:aconitase B